MNSSYRYEYSRTVLLVGVAFSNTKSFLAVNSARSGWRVRTVVLGKNGQNFAQKFPRRTGGYSGTDFVVSGTVSETAKSVPLNPPVLRGY